MHKKYRRQDRDPGWLGYIMTRTKVMLAFVLTHGRHANTDRGIHVLNINVQNILLVFHNLVYNWRVQLALGTALMLEYLCDNIGLVLVYLPCGSTNTSIT